MVLMWQAVRAATVETAGVVTVVLVLSSAAGWTLESAGVQTGPWRLAPVREWFQNASEQLSTAITPAMSAAQREHYVEQRLGHYSHVYRAAAGGCLKQIARDLSNKAPGPESTLARDRPISPTEDLTYLRRRAT